MSDKVEQATYEKCEYDLVLKDEYKNYYSKEKPIESWHYEIKQAKEKLVEMCDYISKQDKNDNLKYLDDYARKLEIYANNYRELSKIKPKSNFVYVYGVFDCAGGYYEGIVDIDKMTLSEGIAEFYNEAVKRYGHHYNEPAMLINCYEVIEYKEENQHV